MPDTPKRPFKISVASELMKNQVPAEVVGHKAGMVSVHDLAGEPMLFSIGNDGVLNAVMRSGGNRIGWQTFSLTTKQKASGLKVIAFAVDQLATGAIVLAAVMAPDSAGELKKSSLYRVTSPLVNDPEQTDWEAVNDQWEECQRHPDGDVLITDISIGAGTADKFPIAVASVRGAGGGETQWIFNADARDAKWTWERFDLPENATGQIVLAAGRASGVRGAYALYETSAGQSLEFRGVTDEIARKSLHRAYNLPAKVQAITVLATEGDSDLYAGGAGLYVFPGSREDATTIATPDRLPAVHEMVITQDVGTVCIFALAGDGLVFHCEGTAADAKAWGMPLQIMSDVSRIAAARNTSRATNQIFAAKGKSDLVYLYQDAASTLWKETEIRLPATNRVAEFMTFTTHVRVTDATGQAMIHTNVKVSADTWTQLFLNGGLHGVDGEGPATVVTDLLGDLTIVSDAMDISSPTITVLVDGEPPVTFNPADGVKGKLEKVKDFAEERLPDGQPLLNEAQRKDTETCKSVKAGMQGLLAGPPKKSAHNDAAGLGAQPADVVWGMTITGPKVQFHEHRASAARLLDSAVQGDEPWRPSDSDWLSAIKAKAGDCLQWMWEKVKEGAQLFWKVVEGAFQVLIKIGQDLLTFVIKGIETTLKVVGWLLEKAFGIDLEKIWKWLGFIFDWEDIKRTHAVFLGLVKRLMDEAKAGVAHFETPVANFFKSLRADLSKMASLPGDAEKFADARRRIDSVPADNREPADKAEASPGASWGQHHFVHSGALGASGPALAAPSDPLSQFMTGVAAPALSSAQAGAAEFVKDLRALFDDPSMTVKQLIAKLVSGTAMALLDVLEKIALGALKFLGEFIDLVRGGLTQPIPIPFFSAFYKDYVVPGHDLSILDLAALLVAIPATIAFKLATGKAPFPADAKPLDLSGLFGLLREPPRHIAPVTASDRAEVDRLEDSPASPDARRYSQIGGFGYAICVALSDVVNLMRVAALVNLFDMDEFKALLGNGLSSDKALAKMKTVGENAIWVIGALGVIKVALSFPVGNKDQVTLQRWAWGVTCARVVGQFAVTKWVGNKWVQAVCMALFVGTTFGLQATVFAKYECAGPTHPNADEMLKFGQNVFYFLADAVSIGASLASDPETKTYLLIGTTFPIGGGLMFNLVRACMNAAGDLEHHNY